MMYDNIGSHKAVPHCHINEAHRTLEVMPAPDDNNVLQISRMREMMLKFSDKVCVGFIRENYVL